MVLVMMLIFSMAAEAISLVRSVGRTAIVLSTVFYYMFFQTQEYQSSLQEGIRIQRGLEKTARTDALNQADIAAYEAKRTGRNRYIIKQF